MKDIIMRPYIPQGLYILQDFAPSIYAASTRYDVSPLAIAGSFALEQNNAEQFYFPSYLGINAILMCFCIILQILNYKPEFILLRWMGLMSKRLIFLIG
jgi:hypothetical protein